MKGWKNLVTREGIEQLKKLPNFDPEVFQEISGFSMEDLDSFEILFRKF